LKYLKLNLKSFRKYLKKWRLADMVRKATNKALEMADEGLISYKTLAEMALKWMSEDDVADMLKANEVYFEDEEEEEIDGLYHDCSEEDLEKMGCFDNFGDEEEESAPYVLFGGTSTYDLQPLSAWFTKEDAINKAGVLIATSDEYTYAEVVYMPEDDDDTNEVVWTTKDEDVQK
jgi:hypothetical protein